MQISEEQLDKFIEIAKSYYPDREFTREEALGDAHRLLNMLEIILKTRYRKNQAEKKNSEQTEIF